MNKIMMVMVLLIMVSGCRSASLDEPVMIEKEVGIDTSLTTTPIEVTVPDVTTMAETITEVTPKSEELSIDDRVEQALSLMTLEDKVGQLFYLDLQSYEATKIPAGGLILFKHDLPSWQATKDLINAYQNATRIPLFIGVDEEGGIVTRITGKDSIGGTPLDSPWNMSHGISDMTVAEGSQVIVEELTALGFNMNFAPVADINSNPDNPIIGKRAYADLPEPTATFVLEALGPYKGTSLIPVVKHFPGHGNTKGDSHEDSVYVEGSLEALEANELIPFKAAIDDGVEVVMMGHIKLPEAVTQQSPASLNQEVIQGILRDLMGFEGLVISDSLIMGSITNHYSPIEVAELGLKAGLNMFLMPEEPGQIYTYLLEEAKKSPEMMEKVNDSVRRILLVKYKHLLN